MEKYTRLKFFEHIPAVPDNGMILTRLGYRKTTTILDDDYKKTLMENINKGLMLCNTKGVFGTFKIEKRDEESVELDNGVVLKSKSLSNFFQTVWMLF